MLKIKLSKKHFGLFILILSLCFGILAFFLGKQLTNLSGLGYIGVFIINLIGSATIVLPMPTLVVTVTAGAFLNPLLTGIFSAVGSTLGELTGYFAGVGGGEIVDKNKKMIKVKGWMDKYGLWVIFVLAAIPNPLFDLAGIVSGASGIPLKKYLLIVLSGKIIKFVTLAYAGFGIFKVLNLAF